MTVFTRSVEVEAVQYTGDNDQEMQEFTGTYNVDPAGQYQLPVFDHADIYWPARTEPLETDRVLRIDGEWNRVRLTDWVVKTGVTFTILSDQDFITLYQ